MPARRLPANRVLHTIMQGRTAKKALGRETDRRQAYNPGIREPESARIDSIDVLRGFALLGILIMNIQLFAMPEAAYYNPTAYGDLEGANLYVWLGGRLLADQKFMTIFSMLFGAGIVLMTSRAEARGETRQVHYRRMGGLALIGLAHAHLLWAGDILFLYAVCGMLVYPFRRQSPGRLLVLGTATVAVASAIFAGLQASLPNWSEEALAEVTLGAWQPTQAIIDDTVATYRGGWLQQLPARSAMALGFETFMLVIWGGWRAGGLMLIGMALFKMDVFSARRPRHFYGALIAAALVAGIPVEAYGVALDFELGWALDWSLLQGRQFNYWPSIAVGLGYVGLVMLACRTAALRRLTRPVRRHRADGADELPPADRDLHDDLLRSRPRSLRVRRPRGTVRHRPRRLGRATGRLAALAAALPLRAGRVGVALPDLRGAPPVPARGRARTLTRATRQGIRPSTRVSMR